MARPSDTTFQPFIVRTLNRGSKTTEELYTIARARKLALTRSRRKDASRPSQFAWQHQLRRDQHVLATQGVIARSSDGTWELTGFAY
jgi:hypothetical protein